MPNLNDFRLKQLAAPLFEARGYHLIEVHFTAFKEMNFRWEIRGKNIVFKVSDYLDEAPDIVIQEFVKGALTYIFGGRHVWGKAYLDYTRSDAFILLKRPVYYKRGRRLARTDVGEFRNIFDAVQRLIDRGLLTEDDIQNTLFTWTSDPTLTRLGYCTQMFRIVVISCVFDDPDIPEDLFDFVVYHECMHLRQGYRPFNRTPHDAAFKASMHLYPGERELDQRLHDIPELYKKSRKNILKNQSIKN